MLFLPYSNGRKKLLPIKEIPKPLWGIYHSQPLFPLWLGTVGTWWGWRPNLGENWYYLFSLYIGQKCYNASIFTHAPLISTTMMMFFEKRDSLWWCSLKNEFSQAFGHLKLSFGKSWHFRLKKMTRICYWLLESKSGKSTIHRLLFTILFYCSWHCSLRNFAYLREVVP